MPTDPTPSDTPPSGWQPPESARRPRREEPADEPLPEIAQVERALTFDDLEEGGPFHVRPVQIALAVVLVVAVGAALFLYLSDALTRGATPQFPPMP